MGGEASADMPLGDTVQVAITGETEDQRLPGGGRRAGKTEKKGGIGEDTRGERDGRIKWRLV